MQYFLVNLWAASLWWRCERCWKQRGREAIRGEGQQVILIVFVVNCRYDYLRSASFWICLCTIMIQWYKNEAFTVRLGYCTVSQVMWWCYW